MTNSLNFYNHRTIGRGKIVKNTTCFSAHKRLDLTCDKTDCRHWINLESHQNCTLISAQKGPKTLQEIGDIFGLTRMRVCQIEKAVIRKINQKI